MEQEILEQPPAGYYLSIVMRTEKRKWDWVALMVEDILPGVMLAWRRECAVQYRPDLTAERLRELLHYDPDSGEFRWIVPRQKIQVGDIAGSRHKNGRWGVKIDGGLPNGARHTRPQAGRDHPQQVVAIE